MVMVRSANNFYLSLVAFVVSVGIATAVTFSYSTLIWLLFLSLLCALWYRRFSNTAGAKVWLCLSLILAFFVFGVLRTSLYNDSFERSGLENQLGQKTTLVGLVVNEPEQTASSLQLTVKTTNTKVIVTTDRYADVRYGDEVTIAGVIKKPEPFVTNLGREFDYTNYLLARGVEFQMSFASVEVIRHNQGNEVIARLLILKKAFLQKLNTYLIEPNSGLAAGLLLGVKQGLGETLEADFRTTGIIHIVVLSGYNIMLIVTFVLYIFGSFLSKRGQIIAGVITIAGFALMVGLSATVVRACLMATLLLLAEATGRHYLALRALLLAGAFMLLVNPYLLIFDIGFQLSFLATLGLILLAPILERFLTKIPNWFGIRLFVLATVSTQIIVLPLLLYYMGQFSVLAVIVNVLVLPMVPLAMLLAFLTGLFGFVWSALATLVAVPTYFSLSYIIVSAHFFASLPFASFSVANFSAWWLVPTYSLLGLFIFMAWSRHNFSLSANSPTNSVTEFSGATDFSDWLLEEETDDDFTKAKIKTVTSKKEVTANEVPIFFR